MIAVDSATDTRFLRTAFGCFPSGVAVLAAESETGPVGMTISTFTPVSLQPPLVSVCIQNGSRTWASLQRRPRLGVSILGADQEQVGRALAGPGPGRFTNLEVNVRDGAVFVEGAALWLNTELYDTLPAGDHTIALLLVRGVDAEPQRSPLVFHASSFHSLSARSAWPDRLAGPPGRASVPTQTIPADTATGAP